jgi:protein-arginine kinase activator protein McsA
MVQTLAHSGFCGVTFINRPATRYGIRPVPYYQFDGKDLEHIKNHLFRCGISSSISSNKLVIVGTKNCLLLANLLGLDNPWTWALSNIFYKNMHTTPNGIRQLYTLFGQHSKLSYASVERIIAEKQCQKQQKVIENKRHLKLLPAYDNAYKKYTNILCMECKINPAKIYFTGKYPQKGNMFFLCPECVKDKFPAIKKQRLTSHNLHEQHGELYNRYITATCEVCLQNPAQYVYGYGKNSDENISLCEACKNEWLFVRNIDSVIDKILCENFPEFKFQKKQIGKLTPTFVFDESKKIIEVFNCKLHACPIHFPARKIRISATYEYKAQYFAERGYELLVIWGHDFDNIDAVVRRIDAFLHTQFPK